LRSVFPWIVLGDVDLYFLFMLVRKASHQHTQFIYMTDRVTVTSLSASLLQQINVATDCVCNIMLKQNCTKRNCVKWDLPVHAYTLLYVGYISTKKSHSYVAQKSFRVNDDLNPFIRFIYGDFTS